MVKIASNLFGPNKPILIVNRNMSVRNLKLDTAYIVPYFIIGPKSLEGMHYRIIISTYDDGNTPCFVVLNYNRDMEFLGAGYEYTDCTVAEANGLNHITGDKLCGWEALGKHLAKSIIDY